MFFLSGWGEQLEESEDLVYQMRKKAVENLAERFPVLGEFSPEQYGEEGRSMGSVYVPDFKEHVRFTNLKGKHFRLFYRAFWMQEVDQAIKENRDIDDEKIIGYGEYLLANLNGWVANMYNRTGMEALRANPIPTSRPSWRERRRMRKQGGW